MERKPKRIKPQDKKRWDRFISEYCKDLNPTRAYLAANKTKNRRWAQIHASKLLTTNHYIKAQVAEKLKKQEEEADKSAAEIIKEWQINKPLGQCCGSGRDIEPGEEYFAALIEMPDGLQRRDFCAEFWNQSKPQVYCYWKSKLPDPQQKKQIFVDDEMLMAFFERLEQEQEREKINFRFVLMLVLMRKRKLKYDSTQIKDSKEIWKLRVVGADQYVEVENPHLDEEQIQQLSSQIGEILQVDL